MAQMAILEIKHPQGHSTSVALTAAAYVLGRASSCDILLDDQQVSRRHAQLTRRDGSFFIKDLESRNLTFVNGNAVKEAELRDRDRLRVGPFVLVFHAGLAGEEQIVDFGQTIAFLQPLDVNPIDQASAAELLMIEHVNRTISSVATLEGMIDFLFQTMRDHLPCDRMGIAFVEESGQRIRSYYNVANYEPLELSAGHAEDLHGSSLAEVIEKGTPRIINDLEAYLALNPDSISSALMLREGIRSNMTCPLRVADRNVGLLFRSSRRAHAFSQHHVMLHDAVVNLLSQAVEKAYNIQRLEAATRAYFEILGFVSHELKSPVSSMISLADVMKRGYLGPLTPKQEDAMQRVIAKGHYLLGLVKEYLDLSQIESGQLRTNLTPVDDYVQAVVKPAIDILLPQIEEQKVSLTTAVPDRPLSVEVDPNLLRVVLVNLLSNGVKYGNPGGAMRLTVTADRKVVTTSVWNEGPGFPEGQRERLFQKFSRLDTPALNARKGTGLGLYNSWRIVQAHNGRLSAASQEGAWAEFRFTLPFRTPGEGDKTDRTRC